LSHVTTFFSESNEYSLKFSLFGYILFFEGLEDLPPKFLDLHFNIGYMVINSPIEPPFIWRDCSANLNEILSSTSKLAGIYIFINGATGAILYIGSSVNLRKRLQQHMVSGTQSNTWLQRNFKKYGLKNIILIILDTCRWNKETLLNLEQIALEIFKPLCNHLLIAGSSLGFRHSEETRANHSRFITGRHTGEKNPFYGKTHTAETRAAISEKVSGEKHPMYGKLAP